MRVLRSVCLACGANWLPGTAHGDKCPSCRGAVQHDVQCDQNEAGVVTADRDASGKLKVSK